MPQIVYSESISSVPERRPRMVKFSDTERREIYDMIERRRRQLESGPRHAPTQMSQMGTDEWLRMAADHGVDVRALRHLRPVEEHR